MNVGEINPGTTENLAHYVEAVVGLTLFTSWLVIAMQKDSFFFPPDSSVMHRTLWPLYFVNGVISTEIRKWRHQLTDRRPPPDIRPSY